MEKMTRKEALAGALETVKLAQARGMFDAGGPCEDLDFDAIVAKMEHELEVLSRKGSKAKAASKIDPELVERVAEALEAFPEGVSLTQLSKDAFAGEFTSQKLRPVMQALMDAGCVERFEVKRKAMFRLV